MRSMIPRFRGYIERRATTFTQQAAEKAGILFLKLLYCGGVMRAFLVSRTTCHHGVVQNRTIRRLSLHKPQKRFRFLMSRAAVSEQKQEAPATSPAAESVEKGLQLFQDGSYEQALVYFLKANQMQPNKDEARAALYNAACAHTKLRQWQLAADAVVAAINDYDLKLSVAMKDPDLESLRERREWFTALDGMKGGISKEQYVRLKSEAKAPFRFTRIYLFGSLAGGAGLGLLIIATRLIAALQGDGDLQESLINFSINAAALALFGFLVYRDYSKQQQDIRQIEREEALGRLQVTMSSDRILPLSAFRGSTRPVIVAGSKGQVSKALAVAEPLREQLRERGVSVVPIIVNEDDPEERLRKLKMELNGPGLANFMEDQALGFGANAKLKKESAKPSQQLTKKDKRWELEACNPAEWALWLEEQKKAANIAETNCVYVQIQLDGSVRASGVGSPPWKLFVRDLPELSSMRTKFTDGAGVA